jgi:hypothetical protein
LTIRINRLTRGLRKSAEVQKTVIEAASNDLADLERRVSALDAHTDISGLRKQLTEQAIDERLRAIEKPRDPGTGHG